MAATVILTVLNRKNYDIWCSRIKTYLSAEDLWDVVHLKSPNAKYKESKAWKKKDAKALYAIQNSCEDVTYGLIKDMNTAKEAWDALSEALKSAVKNGHDESASVNSEESNEDDGTVLHNAIKKYKDRSLIKHLVECTATEDLIKPDSGSLTALDLLIKHYPEGVELAKCMVKKNPKLVTSRTVLPPVVRAQSRTKGETMARFLYFEHSRVSPESLKDPDTAYLISLGFRHKRFDIAWDLIQRRPKLAMTEDTKGDYPLVTLASNRFAFKSESRLNLWEKFIYKYGKCIKPLPLIKDDICINVEKPENDQSDQRHLISSGMSLLLGLVVKFQTFFGIDRIYHMKLVHERFKQLLNHIRTNSTEISQDLEKVGKLTEALFVAAERGHVDYILFINRLLKDSKESIFDKKNRKGQYLLQVAAECRQHKVYSLIHDLDELHKTTIVGKQDNFGNNMLHTVASITPLSQIHHIQGAALQMQRELQWFKEVESIDPVNCESRNKDNKTPREVFTENHKEMLKAAENSMKETATSCTVVGALIITIMFAAAFTIPGGNDEKTGLPKVFTTFIVSDAISLFSSTTSVIMFLGILTSRYSEDDFCKSLPRKMIIGLFTLFLSVTTMMIVFSCGLYIMLDDKLSIAIPSILLAIVPVASFVWMQLPLLFELFISTFVQGIFDRNPKKLL